MRFKLRFIVLLCVFLLSNCSNESDGIEDKSPGEEEVESVEKVLLFKYSSSLSAGSEKWVVVYDNLGKVLDYKQLPDTGIIEFVIDKDSLPEKISITRLSYNKDANNDSQYHNLTSYTDISGGSSWEENFSFSQGSLIGNFNFHIENIPGLESYVVSTSKGHVRIEDFTTETILEKTKLNLTNIPLYENEEYLISIKDSNKQSKYFIIYPENEAEINKDYESFMEFDDYVEFDLPPNEFTIYHTNGFKSLEDNTYFLFGHIFNDSFIYSEKGLHRAEYINGYAKYTTVISVNQGDFGYGLNVVGDKVKEIIIPDEPSFMIENPSIYDLRFSTELNPISKSTHYLSGVYDTEGALLQTRWEVFSTGSKSQKIGRIPDELIERFPQIDTENLELRAVNLRTVGLTQQELFELESTEYRTGTYINESYGFRGFN